MVRSLGGSPPLVCDYTPNVKEIFRLYSKLESFLVDLNQDNLLDNNYYPAPIPLKGNLIVYMYIYIVRKILLIKIALCDQTCLTPTVYVSGQSNSSCPFLGNF